MFGVTLFGELLLPRPAQGSAQNLQRVPGPARVNSAPLNLHKPGGPTKKSWAQQDLVYSKNHPHPQLLLWLQHVQGWSLLLVRWVDFHLYLLIPGSSQNKTEESVNLTNLPRTGLSPQLLSSVENELSILLTGSQAIDPLQVRELKIMWLSAGFGISIFNVMALKTISTLITLSRNM